MRKGARELYEIDERVRRLKNRLIRFNATKHEPEYDQLTKEAGGLYTLLRKLKRDKKIVF